jgi:hypothetical protein
VKKKEGSTNSSPWVRAKSSAPGPIIMTWGEFSITPPGEADGVADAGEARDGSGLERGPVHDGGVELVTRPLR